MYEPQRWLTAALRDAYETLKDDRKRHKYDQLGSQPVQKHSTYKYSYASYTTDDTPPKPDYTNKIMMYIIVVGVLMCCLIVILKRIQSGS